MKYFSKYRNAWVPFKQKPTRGQLIELQKYNYRIMVDGSEIEISKLIK